MSLRWIRSPIGGESQRRELGGMPDENIHAYSESSRGADASGTAEGLFV